MKILKLEVFFFSYSIFRDNKKRKRITEVQKTL